MGQPLDLEEAMARFQGQDPILLVDLNVDLDEAQNPRSQPIADLLMEFGLIDFIHTLRQRLCCCHPNTWPQICQVAVLRLRCNYILGTDQRLFKIVGIWDLRNYPSDHFVLRERLPQTPARCHGHYLWVRRDFPFYLPTDADLSMVDTMFQALYILDLPAFSLTHPLTPCGCHWPPPN